MIRVGIIGCGKMADQHTAQIKRIADAQIIGVCDAEPLMARQLAERLGVTDYFSNVDEMLATLQFDVIHITTPPHSHHQLGRKCLEAGCHVYMEKPFTINTAEAEDLIALATQNGLKITAGHNAQFTHAMIEMRKLVQQGYLGGNPVHMECQYCYELADEAYAKAFLGDRDHWIRKLPGSLLQNIISHGVSKIAEFLAGEDPHVIACGFTSPLLLKMNEVDIIDEVRVIIKDQESTTAYFTFSSQIGPSPHAFRLYGPKRSLFVDEDHQLVVKMNNKAYKSYLNYFVPPIGFARQYLGNFGKNFSKFLQKEFHLPNDAGLKTLINAFYSSIIKNEPLPISYREIILTSRIMDSIFEQIKVTTELK